MKIEQQNYYSFTLACNRIFGNTDFAPIPIANTDGGGGGIAIVMIGGRQQCPCIRIAYITIAIVVAIVVVLGALGCGQCSSCSTNSICGRWSRRCPAIGQWVNISHGRNHCANTVIVIVKSWSKWCGLVGCLIELIILIMLILIVGEYGADAVGSGGYCCCCSCYWWNDERQMS